MSGKAFMFLSCMLAVLSSPFLVKGDDTINAFDYVNVIAYDYIIHDLGDYYWGDLEFESTSGNTESFWAAIVFSDHDPASLLKDKSKSTTMSTTHTLTSDAYTANQEIELNDVASFYIDKSSSTPKIYEHIVYLKSSYEDMYRIVSLETSSSSATLKVEGTCAAYLAGDNSDISYLSEGSSTSTKCLVAINGDDGIIYFINMVSGDIEYYAGNSCTDELTSCDLDWKGLHEADVKFSMIPLGEVGYYEEGETEAYFVVSNVENDLLLIGNNEDDIIEFTYGTMFFIATEETSTGIYEHVLHVSYYSDGFSDSNTLLSIETLDDSTSEECNLKLSSTCELFLEDGNGSTITIYEATDADSNCVVGFYGEATLKMFDYYEAEEIYSYNDQCDEYDLSYCDLTYGCDEDEVEDASYFTISSSSSNGFLKVNNQNNNRSTSKQTLKKKPNQQLFVQ